MPPTLDEDLGTIHREELHLLHFSDSPEENLRRGWQGCHTKAQGGASRHILAGNGRCGSVNYKKAQKKKTAVTANAK
eukprot:bmy_22297T0